ncbi:MAG: helicase-associated domain-containing protein [Chloroflexota bacterium]
MRSLEKALHEHELIVLRVIGEWWEMDLTGQDKTACVAALTERLQQVDMSAELLYLPPEEAQALRDLAAADGRLPVAKFSRRYGEVRLMGPGRLEREEPWYDPENVAEALWYRGFLYRGFDDTADEIIEFYYVPTDLLALFPAAETTATEPLVLADRAEPAAHSSLTPANTPVHYQTAVTDAVDDITTMLALAQVGRLRPQHLENLLLNADTDRRSLLLTLCEEMGLVKRQEERLRPTRAAVSWLRQSREAQLRALADAWSSSGWNDLCHTPGLACEGENWRNDPLLARSALLEILPRRADWYSLAGLTDLIRSETPDFQRPDGNYDTWYIRDKASDNYISGFENWALVEGRLLRFLLSGPMRWLGLVEIATDDNNPADLLFRLTTRALDWLSQQPVPTEEVKVPLVVQPDGLLLVPYNADRYQRFQTARITEPEPVTAGQPFPYRLTPQSLAYARQQGIEPDRVLDFLAQVSGRPVPAGVKRAIVRWGEKGVEGRLETAVILRVRDEAILDTLRQNPKTRDYIGESLGPLAAVVRPHDWPHLQQATAELGLFLEANVAK